MLQDDERRFLAQQRIAHLATADRRAVPHVVPVCFAVLEPTLYITIDEKPKRRPPRRSSACGTLPKIPRSPSSSTATTRIGRGSAG